LTGDDRFRCRCALSHTLLPLLFASASDWLIIGPQPASMHRRSSPTTGRFGYHRPVAPIGFTTSYTAFPIVAKISAVDVANSARQDATTVLDRTYWRVHKQVPRARIVSDSRRGTRQSTRQCVHKPFCLDSGRDFEVDVGKPQ
jgi:hypothetical protein